MIFDEDRLLIDAGDVVALDGGLDVRIERREIIASVLRLRRPVDRVMDEVVAEGHERHSVRLRRGGRFFLRRDLGNRRLCRVVLLRRLLHSRRGGGCGRAGPFRVFIAAPHGKAAEHDGGEQQHDQDRAQRGGRFFLRTVGHTAASFFKLSLSYEKKRRFSTPERVF